MARSSGPLTYVIRAADMAIGDTRPQAHAICAGCGVKGMVPVGGISNNPEKIEKMFLRRDWAFDRFNASKCLCPDCVKRREARLEREREEQQQKERLAATKGARVLPTVAPAVLPPVPPPEPRGMRDAMATGPKPKPPSEPPMIPIKDLPAATKGILRTAIEAYFDADAGAWQQDWSDEKVAKEANVPRVTVTEFRDTFYGPIKEDPVVRALQDEIAQAKRILTNMQDITLPKLEKKLDEYRKKVGL